MLSSMMSSFSEIYDKSLVDLKSLHIEEPEFKWSFRAVLDVIKTDEFRFWCKIGFCTICGISSLYIIYKTVENIDSMMPNKRQKTDQGKALLKKLGIDVSQTLNNHELMIASNIVDIDDLQTDWEDIGGLNDVIEELNRSVLSPIKDTENIIQSNLYKPPKGMLIYGPPGCGKTMLVKAIAKTTKARFINLQISSITDMYFGESEKYIEAIFSLADKIQPVIIFIDEIDGLMTSRSKSLNHDTFLSMKTTFMSLWDGMLTNKDSKIMIVGASNRPNSIDDAILRRLQIKIEVKLPNESERRSIFKVILKNEKMDQSITDCTFDNLAKLSEGFSGSSIKDICQDAVINAVEKFKTRSNKSTAFVLNEEDIYASLYKFIHRMERIRIY